MLCEREGCGHPLAVHDPCSICGCPGYEPADRKARAALLTDVFDEPHKVPPTAKVAQRAFLADLRANERRRLGGLS